MRAVSTCVQRTLSNGVELIATPMPHTAAVSLHVASRAGSGSEPAESGGVTHFVEHMLFRRRTHEPGAFASAVERLGGQINAATEPELTVVGAKVPAEAWPDALRIVSRMVGEPTMDPDEIEKERAVLAQRIYREIRVQIEEQNQRQTDHEHQGRCQFAKPLHARCLSVWTSGFQTGLGHPHPAADGTGRIRPNASADPMQGNILRRSARRTSASGTGTAAVQRRGPRKARVTAARPGSGASGHRARVTSAPVPACGPPVLCENAGRGISDGVPWHCCW